MVQAVTLLVHGFSSTEKLSAGEEVGETWRGAAGQVDLGWMIFDMAAIFVVNQWGSSN